jgi:CheY-like chemotaxis protein
VQRPPTAAKILIVEDNEADIRLFKINISDYRIFNEFLWARDGDEALHLIREDHPDLVLLDTGLPGRDGFEILEEIRGDEGLKSAKVIIVSGIDDMDYVRSRAPNADGFLVKPVTLADLADTASKIDGFSLGVVRS